jgi:hypothetical protein
MKHLIMFVAGFAGFSAAAQADPFEYSHEEVVQGQDG